MTVFLFSPTGLFSIPGGKVACLKPAEYFLLFMLNIERIFSPLAEYVELMNASHVQTTRNTQNLFQPAFNMVTSRLALTARASSTSRQVLTADSNGNTKLDWVLWRKAVVLQLAAGVYPCSEC